MKDAAQSVLRDSLGVMKVLLSHPGLDVNMTLAGNYITFPAVAKMFNIDSMMTNIAMTPLTIALLTDKAPYEIVRLLLTSAY